eukprot:8661867-Heterocapsa_arctica.AAC.1
MTSLSSCLSVLSQLEMARPWTPPSCGNDSSRPWWSSSARPGSIGGGSPSSPDDYSMIEELDRAKVAMAGSAHSPLSLHLEAMIPR